MAHRSTITSVWTAVIAALVALLAALGLGGKAAPAAVGVSASDAPAAAAVCRPVVMARRTWRAMMRGGSLPPTIKQRIRAEAHGKTPSARRSTTAAALAAGAHGGAAGTVGAAGAVGALAEAVGALGNVGSAGAVRDGLALAA